MTLFDKIQSDLKEAQLKQEQLKVSTLRLLLSEIRYAEIQKRQGERSELSDDEIILVVQREVKKRKEAAAGFKQGGRIEAADKEENEAKILEEYLPQQLSDEELTKLVEQAITDTGAASISEMGKVIGLVMGQVKGRSDGARISALVQQRVKQKLING
ncbi:MAG: hypothetical protein UT58_C0032G0005 [Microgenomates group bacterium GW2011_GWC1_39_7b]|uniref:Glutamyl-tRNA amidotransferase n=2 Tax=Candidatus Daviesiibacteriota TaxID=1752718 RepID=A0A1F5N0Y9_9BACT|nr:MAG: hypothetical protein UT58_C0032G0005 [Microgenomates group bacterium GW2011_GWC1_39_7b]KKS14375.1 MAG: hypothetical protein UU67_C0002G0041 [Candidatus Daviesbacteria bacterium GW2011_GWB1_41_5]OGE71288.1 MAG: hypothetical protein A2617_02065 [Candidatus Daviesbacteria bacterium RIFOXYD1_FULL_41_10]